MTINEPNKITDGTPAATASAARHKPCEARGNNFSPIYKDGFVVKAKKECVALLERLFGDGTWLKKILTTYLTSVIRRLGLTHLFGH
jgi:hypothetical protein